jgi:hypothetical protein
VTIVDEGMHACAQWNPVRASHTPERALIYPYPTHAQQHHFEEIVARRERRRIAKDGAVAAAVAEDGAKAINT